MKKLSYVLTITVISFLTFCLNKTGFKILRVISNSMEPTINKGSILILKPSKIYKKGDIVSYKSLEQNVPVTHRIVEINKINGVYYFQTKGDKNQVKDPNPVSEKEILGKVIFISPNLTPPEYQRSFYFAIFITSIILSGLLLGLLLGSHFH